MNGEIHLAAFADSIFREGKAAASAGKGSKAIELRSELRDATSVVYSVLSREDRKVHGVFFSGPEWAKTLTAHVDISRWTRFVDPSAGTGDILLEICRSFPLANSLQATVRNWGKKLVAGDLRSSFLRIAWARIVKLAVERHAIQPTPSQLHALLVLPEAFICSDMLKTNFKLTENDCVIMNPPYQRIQAGSSSFVGQGLRSAAALHVEHILHIAPAGVGMVALVPEVLRTGASYGRFRREVQSRVDVVGFESFGRFGQSADVDVAVLAGITTGQRVFANAKDSAEGSKEARSNSNVNSIGARFTMCVGPVVPHRTAECEIWHQYLSARNAPVGEALDASSELANFDARLERGPFVVVRRTSSPSDKQRARATLVNSCEEFLIENHLIVCKPKAGGVKACRELMKVLMDERTNVWLNENLRCRHLTVGAIANMPWWKQRT